MTDGPPKIDEALLDACVLEAVRLQPPEEWYTAKGLIPAVIDVLLTNATKAVYDSLERLVEAGLVKRAFNNVGGNSPTVFQSNNRATH